MIKTLRLILVAAILVAAPASATEKAARLVPVTASDKTVRAAATKSEPINASISYNINLPLSEGAMLVDAANNRAYKRSLYQKAAAECEDFLATIAKACQITNLSVSTNENRYAGQPATLSVSVNVNMLITPK